MSIFWELHQHFKINSAAREADRAYYKARTAREEVLELRARCNKTLLICEALWTFIRDEMGVTEEDLLERIRKIDLQDGTEDGKVRRPPEACPRCGRPVTRRHPYCLYCGAPVVQDPFVV